MSLIQYLNSSIQFLTEDTTKLVIFFVAGKKQTAMNNQIISNVGYIYSLLLQWMHMSRTFPVKSSH